MRFDVIFGETVTIEPHFCREIDCFGYNSEHGFSLEEVCEIAAQWHEEQAKLWRTKQHGDVLYYTREGKNNYEG